MSIERRELLEKYISLALHTGKEIIKFSPLMAISGIAEETVQQVVDITDFTQDFVTDYFEGNSKEINSPLFEVQLAVQMNKVNSRYKIFLKNAKSPFDVTGKSRIDYAQEEINTSHLPEELKRLMLFAGFEESFGFSSRAHSPAGADGPWQFMPRTGKKYGLRDRADRRDMKKSTQAAIAYYQDNFNSFKSDQNWKKIKSDFNLDDDELAPFIISAFNAGESHIKYVFDLMANNSKERKIAQKYAKTGKFGLFSYMYYEYKPRWKDLQRGKAKKKGYNFKRQYYHKHASNYVYKIMAFHHIHNGLGANATPEVIQKFSKIDSSELSNNSAAIVGGIASLVTYLTFKNRKNVLETIRENFGINKLKMIKEVTSMPPEMNRRDFIKGVSMASIVGALGGVLNAKFDVLPHITDNTLDIAMDSISGILPQKITGKFDSESAEAKRVLNEAKKLRKFPKDVDGVILNKTHYFYNQYMADKAFEFYKKSNNSDQADIYLSISLHFYKKALDIAQRQKSGEISYRPKNKVIEKRIKYCQNSLAVIKSE